MTEHTKGPWDIEYDNADDGSGQWYSVGPATVWATYSIRGEKEREWKANAALIAAAPDMYEALKLFVECPEVDRDEAWVVARAALRKAEGKE